MARLPLPPGQKKEGVALDFSPLLIRGIDALRGSRSRSSFIEEWLREQPEIAQWLREHQDSGFNPPASHYKCLMDLLLQFYYPDFISSSSVMRALDIAHKCIMRNVSGEGSEIQEEISGSMRDFWKKAREEHGHLRARGTPAEAERATEEYARFYYESIFLKMAQGERALLQSRFRSLVRGCEAVYRAKLREERDRKMMDEKLSQAIKDSLQESVSCGDDPEDSKWMAQGAVIHYGREQGLLGESLSEEESTAIEQAVKQAMDEQSGRKV